MCNKPALSNWTSIDKPVKTCRPDVSAVEDEKFTIVSADSSVEGISISHQKNVNYLPQNLAMFPEIIGLNIFNCSLKVIDYNDLKNLWKLRALHVQYNDIAYIASDAFKDLVSLESFYATFNKIQFLDSKIFESQRNLKILYLGGNRIEFLHPKIFNPLVNVLGIYLNDNKLLSISENIFENLPNLKNASLGPNQMVEIPEKIFASNLKLEYAWCNANKIKFVKPETFAHLASLQLVNLSGNECIDKYYWSSAFNDMKKDLKDKCSSDQTKLEDKNKNMELQIAILTEAHLTLVQEIQKLRLEIENLKNDIQAVNKTVHGVSYVF